MTKEVKAQSGDGKMVKRRSSYEAVSLDIKRPTATRLTLLHTDTVHAKGECIVTRKYRDRKGNHYTMRKVYESAVMPKGTSWQWTNCKLHPVIPSSGF